MLINIGAAYFKAEDIKMLTMVDLGEDKEKPFAIKVITNVGNYAYAYESKAARDEKIKQIQTAMNGQSEELIEIRKQPANINARLNQIDKKLKALQEPLFTAHVIFTNTNCAIHRGGPQCAASERRIWDGSSSGRAQILVFDFCI